MKKKGQKSFDTKDYFPEYTTPKYGEKVESFAVKDVNGKKRTTYVRNDEKGYPYKGKQFMYEVFKVDGGWQVAWVENPDSPPRPVRVKPYKQLQGAYRKRKQLNDALQNVDAMIAKDGAIIL